MAKKAFEIQGANLTLGGVNLQAGTTGVVIPGVTQATGYVVEEVDDRADQTVTFQSAPILIDYVTYLDYQNNGTSSGRAEYSVDELDDDGYIDGINIDSQGSYTSSEGYNGGNDLFAYTGTDTMPGIFVSFVDSDWTQIPFRPKMRAGEVENIGGGADLGSFTIDGNVIEVDSGTDIYLETFEDGGNGESRLVLKPEDDQGGSNPTRLEGSYGVGIWTNTTDAGNGNEKKWLFGNNGDLKLPQGGDIVDSTGASVLGGGSGSTTKTWTNPNSNVWTIEEYSGGWAGGYNHPAATITYTFVESQTDVNYFMIDSAAYPSEWQAIDWANDFSFDGGTVGYSGYSFISGTTYRVDLGTNITYNTGDTITINYGDRNQNPVPSIWWDADNSPSGNNNFRGAIIEYHAYCGAGTVIGKIIIAADDENAVTHMESMGGGSNLGEYEFWYAPDYGQLAVRRVGSDANNDDQEILIQWTGKIFYGSEYDC